MFRLALSSLALLLLAACGGGGGSSSSAPATPAGIPVSIQGPNTTQQYPVSSAAATFSTNTGVGVSGIAASDGGSTVTVSTDANGNLSMFTLNISTGGINYNQTFTSFSPITQPLTVSDIANGLNEIANAPAGSTAAFVTSQNNGQLKGLSFSAF